MFFSRGPTGSFRLKVSLGALFCLLLVLADCGSSSNNGDFVYTGTNGGNGTGSLTFNFVTTQAIPVPETTTQVRFRFYSGANGTGDQIQDEKRDFAPTIVIERVDPRAASVRVTAYDTQGAPTVEFTLPVSVQPGGNVTVNLGTATGQPVNFTGLQVSPGSASVAQGATFQFNARLSYSNGDTITNNSLVEWEATGGAATVDQDGLATGTAVGTSTITASAGEESASATLQVTSGGGPTVTITGTVTFERLIPLTNIDNAIPDFGDGVLDFANPVETPVRFGKVQAISSGGGTVAIGRTNGAGIYSLAVPANAGQVRIRVLSETEFVAGESGAIRVQDNTNDDAVYAVESDPVPSQAATVDISIPSGYDASGVQPPDTVRSAGAFACLDGIQSGYRYFLDAGLDASQLDLCVVNWSENNRPEPGEPGDGAIGTSFYTSATNELFILGFAEVDTDENDWNVIIHEFGHWLQANRFRDDSLGGAHGLTDLKDARLAMSEGFGNAFGVIVLGDGLYIDTATPSGFSFSQEFNYVAYQQCGWANEGTVGTIINDLFDGIGTEPTTNFNDQLQLPPSAFFAAMDFQAGSDSLTTIFSFLEGITDTGLSPSQTSALTALLASNTFDAEFGINSTDEFAAGETHDPYSLGLIPLYTDITSGIPGSFNLTVLEQLDENYNWVFGSRYVTFVGDGSPMTITANNSTSAVGNLALDVWQNGENIAFSFPDSASQNAVVSFNTINGALYVVTIVNLGELISETTVDFDQ